jgi:hypothetical protein
MAEKTIQEQVIREAPEIEAIKLGLLEDAQQLAGIPIDLPEQLVAGFTPEQLEAFIKAQQGVGAFLPQQLAGEQAFVGGLGALAGAQLAALDSAQKFQPTTEELKPFQDPFQQQVIDETLKRLNEEGLIAGTQLAAKADAAGAFGGSRFGLESGQLQEGLQDARARALAALNSQNFLQSLGAGSQAFEQQQARQQNQANLLSGIGQLAAGIGGQQIGAGLSRQQAGITDINTLLATGGQQQGLQQALFDADQQNRLRQLYEPIGRVSWLSDIYKGAPSSSTVLASSAAPSQRQPTSLQQYASVGTGLLGAGVAANNLTGGGLFGTPTV